MANPVPITLRQGEDIQPPARNSPNVTHGSASGGGSDGLHPILLRSSSLDQPEPDFRWTTLHNVEGSPSQISIMAWACGRCPPGTACPARSTGHSRCRVDRGSLHAYNGVHRQVGEVVAQGMFAVDSSAAIPKPDCAVRMTDWGPSPIHRGQARRVRHGCVLTCRSCPCLRVSQ